MELNYFSLKEEGSETKSIYSTHSIYLMIEDLLRKSLQLKLFKEHVQRKGIDCNDY